MLFIAVSLLLSSAPTALPQEGELHYRPAVVRAGQTAVLRPFYDKKTAVLLKLEEATPLKVVAENTPWVRVLVAGGMSAWVHQDFIKLEGRQATVTASKLRARSLPSTAAGSHVLGLFPRGSELTVIGQQDEWLRVLGGDKIGVWVHKDQVHILAAEDAKWTRSWKESAQTRHTALLAEAKKLEQEGTPPQSENSGAGAGRIIPPDPVGGNEAGKEPAAGSGEGVAGTGEALPAAADAAQAATGAAGGAAAGADAGAVAKTAAPQWTREEILREKPSAAVQGAWKAMEAHAASVTARLDAFDPQQILAFERVFSFVLLRNQNPDLLEQARRGLTKVDALRRFHRSALEARHNRDALSEQAPPNAAQAAAAASAAARPGESYTWIGILSYRPHQNQEYPFVSLRGDRQQRVHCFDGRYYLKDYVGREIALRGSWRASGKKGQERVLAIEELRVLPRPKRTP